MVGHLSTTEVLTRDLIGEEQLKGEAFGHRITRKPYGLMTIVEEDCSGNGSWRKVMPPVYPLTWDINKLLTIEEVLKLILSR